MKRKSYRRRQLIKAFFIFQCKLFLDWFRDLIFSPVALFCVVVDLIAGADEKSGLFNRLMLLGVASDRWINMFNSHSSEPGEHFDQWVEKADAAVRKRRNR